MFNGYMQCHAQDDAVPTNSLSDRRGGQSSGELELIVGSLDFVLWPNKAVFSHRARWRDFLWYFLLAHSKLQDEVVKMLPHGSSLWRTGSDKSVDIIMSIKKFWVSRQVLDVIDFVSWIDGACRGFLGHGHFWFHINV